MLPTALAFCTFWCSCFNARYDGHHPQPRFERTVAEGLVAKTGNPHFVYDSYRRFVQMYGDVVLGMKPENKEDIDPFEAIIEEVKAIRGIPPR